LLKFLNFLYAITCHVISNKLNSSQYRFLKAKSTTTNSVTYLDFISAPVGSQVGCISFDLNSELELVSHSILLHKLCARGLTKGYENRFRSCLSNRQFSVHISDVLSKFYRGPIGICCRTIGV